MQKKITRISHQPIIECPVVGAPNRNAKERRKRNDTTRKASLNEAWPADMRPLRMETNRNLGAEDPQALPSEKPSNHHPILSRRESHTLDGFANTPIRQCEGVVVPTTKKVRGRGLPVRCAQSTPSQTASTSLSVYSSSSSPEKAVVARALVEYPTLC